MKEKREIVYLKADRNSVCHDSKIKIQDVMSVQCADPAICAGIKNKTLYTFKKNDDQKKEGKKKKRMEVFSMLNVIERIQTDYPDVEIVSIGEQDFVVQLLDAPMAPKWLETLKVVVMVVVIFLGAAFTIMAFNNDVSVGEVFDRFYQQVMGKEKPKVSEIEIFYCLGLAVGILVFFNHIGKKKITSDPTPIQVEMRKDDGRNIYHFTHFFQRVFHNLVYRSFFHNTFSLLILNKIFQKDDTGPQEHTHQKTDAETADELELVLRAGCDKIRLYVIIVLVHLHAV